MAMIDDISHHSGNKGKHWFDRRIWSAHRWHCVHGSPMHSIPNGAVVALQPGHDDCTGNQTHMQPLLPSESCEDDPLCALVHHSQRFSPLVELDDAQKIMWLQSQLIGNNLSFPTPFGVRQLAYADHAASGRSLLFIENFIIQHLLPFYGNTHTDDSFVGQRTSRMVKHAEEYIKQAVGGSDDDALLMCGSGCTGAIKRLQEVMGIAVSPVLRADTLDMIRSSAFSHEVDVNERWLVFVGPYEHHSNLLSWRQSLAEVREIPASDVEGRINMERLEEELRSARAQGRRKILGSFSACSNVTGLITDTRAIARLLHRHGALACFDFAAGGPHIQLDMRSSEEDGYDAMVMSPHKFLGGPGTPGLLLIRRSLYKLKNHPPSTCGGGTVDYVNGFNEEDTIYYEKIEEREEAGTPQILGKLRCALTFWVKESVGTKLIVQRENLFMEKVIKSFSSHENIKVLGGKQFNRAPILSFNIFKMEPESSTSGLGKQIHGRFVVKLLSDLFGVQLRGGCACAGPYGHALLGITPELSLTMRAYIQKGYGGLKPGWSRLSLSYCMLEEEVDYVVSAIVSVAKYGHRFLGLYDFDWKSGTWTYSKKRANELVGDDLASNFSSFRHVNDPTLVHPPECATCRNQAERFHHHLERAEAFSYLLPSCPPLRSIPSDVDPRDVYFLI
ncbi:hypothetical protein KP509_29G009200 [Ceratopteris richardii]|nr:hypothetical protein KP509_29G009200 [Ceratopteris richardii]